MADVFVADNSDSVYASINGNPGVMLTFSKQSNYPTATVSGNISDKFDELSGRYEGLTFTTMMDQGDYIYLIIGAIAESLGYGALFAVIILLLFLKGYKADADNAFEYTGEHNVCHSADVFLGGHSQHDLSVGTGSGGRNVGR